MSGINVKPVILEHHKRRDGSYPVKVRITFKRKCKYLPTSLVARKDELNSKLEPKSTSLKTRMLELQREVEDVVSTLSLASLNVLEIEDVVGYVNKKFLEEDVFKLDFLAFGRAKAETMAESSRNGYKSALNALERFCGVPSVDISKITVRFLRQFEDFLYEEPSQVKNPQTGKVVKKKAKGQRAVSAYMGCIRHLHNLAKIEFNEPDLGIIRISQNPFEYYTVPDQPKAQHRDIDKSIIQMMIDQRKELKGRESLGVDVFLIGFALLGMNTADIYSCTDIENDVIHYFRAKTKDRRDDNAEMFARIEDCVKDLVGMYSDKSRQRVFNFHFKYSTKDTFADAVNKGLRSWIKRNEIKGDFTFYSSRHTWATMAYSAGVNPAIITDCLNHSDNARKMDMVYVNKDWSILWEANKKVLDMLDWSKL